MYVCMHWRLDNLSIYFSQRFINTFDEKIFLPRCQMNFYGIFFLNFPFFFFLKYERNESKSGFFNHFFFQNHNIQYNNMSEHQSLYRLFLFFLAWDWLNNFGVGVRGRQKLIAYHLEFTFQKWKYRMPGL